MQKNNKFTIFRSTGTSSSENFRQWKSFRVKWIKVHNLCTKSLYFFKLNEIKGYWGVDVRF